MTAPGGGGRGWWVSFTSCLLVSSKHTSTSVDPELTVVDLQHVLDGADELMAQTNSALPGGGVHQHSFSQGLSAFFQCLAHGFGADAVHYLACHQPVRQQLQRPGGPGPPARPTMVPDLAHVGFTAEISLPNQGFPARFLGHDQRPSQRRPPRAAR